jgi:dolichol-phosphate mannosyltransferase
MNDAALNSRTLEALRSDKPARRPQAPAGHPLAWGWGLAGVLTAQLVIAALVPLLPEEAYHWNFARHPDWSYYDHPPMIAWSIALGRILLGDTPLGVRLVPLLFALGTAWLVARLARHVYGEAGARWAVVLYAGQPATFLIGSWGFPDAPLLFFWMLTLTLVWQALETRRPGWWLAAGVALGGGMLSKYTAAFLVPSVLLYLVCSGRDRRWLATPWPYLAGICSLVVFTPVLYWNWSHQWASFHFQGVERFDAAEGISLAAGVKCAGEQWLGIVPLTLPLAVLAVRRGVRSARPLEQFLFWSFAPTVAFFFTLFTLGRTASFHLLWPLPAYLGLSVAMAGVMAGGIGRVPRFYCAYRAWLVGLGASAGVLALLHAVWVLPGVPPLREIYGWDEVADRAKAVQATLPAGSFYLVTGGRPYPPASQLAFHLRAPSQVYGPSLIDLEGLQYRYWADAEQVARKDAVVVVDGGDPSGHARDWLLRYFRAVEPAGDMCVPVGRISLWSRSSLRFTLYRAYGYNPSRRLQAAAAFPPRLDSITLCSPARVPVADIGAAKPGVDAQEKHGLHRRAGGAKGPADFLGGEQPRSLLGTVQAQRLLAGALEPWPGADRRREKADLESELEHAADTLDGFPQPVRSPLLGHLVP